MTPAHAPGSEPQLDAHEARRFAWRLLGLALLTRVVWAVWVHPPEAHVFSDMARYVERASALASHELGWDPASRTWAWQAWGTHALMAAVLKISGGGGVQAGPNLALTLVWASLWAGVVPMTYLLARRVLRGAHANPRSRAVGWAALLWTPHLSLSGYYLSEAPFTLCLLVCTWGLARLWSEGRGAALVALALAVAFALRPQVILFAALAFGAWAVAASRKHTQARALHVVVIAAGLVLSVGFSAWRFQTQTGYWGGVAENANMNLTAARCHNVVTQAFASPAELERSNARDSHLDGRRVSLPGFRMLASSGAHPLALSPSLGGESIKFVGYIGDPDEHRKIRARCYAQDGWLEQARKSVVNVSLLWAFNYGWPEASDRKAGPWLRGVSIASAWILLIGLLIPSLVGLRRALKKGSENPAALLCALQLLAMYLLAMVFFGTLRLRSPYDPYAIILAIPCLHALGATLWARLRRS